jgi:DNA-damage-inducible protein D
MTNLELIFTMLGEEATKAIAERDNALGFEENHQAAQKGGKAAGKARINLEKDIDRKIVSPKNFKNLDNPNDMIEKIS